MGRHGHPASGPPAPRLRPLGALAAACVRMLPLGLLCLLLAGGGKPEPASGYSPSLEAPGAPWTGVFAGSALPVGPPALRVQAPGGLLQGLGGTALEVPGSGSEGARASQGLAAGLLHPAGGAPPVRPGESARLRDRLPPFVTTLPPPVHAGE